VLRAARGNLRTIAIVLLLAAVLIVQCRILAAVDALDARVGSLERDLDANVNRRGRSPPTVGERVQDIEGKVDRLCAALKAAC
jgi:hypothetical protein